MNCNRCEVFGEIEAWKAQTANGEDTEALRQKREDLIRACRACGKRASARNGWGDTFEHRGQSQVSIDAANFAEVKDDFDLARRRSDSDGCTTLPPAVEDCLRKILTQFSRLTFRDAPVILGLLKGLSLAEIGRKIGMSRAAIHARIKSLIAREPWVKEMRKIYLQDRAGV